MRYNLLQMIKNGLIGKFKFYKIIVFSAIIISLFIMSASSANNESDTHNATEEYLRLLAHDTWNCTAYYVDIETGLPYDNSEKGSIVGIDKIGLYIASVAAAKDLGFIGEEDATAKIERVLNVLERLETWNGSTRENRVKSENFNAKIPFAWYNLSTFNPTSNLTLQSDDHIVAAMDLANYDACLIIGRNAFPKLNDGFTRLIENIKWSAFYDKDNKTFKSIYDLKTDEFDNSEIVDLASDTQTASFLGIAAGAVPPGHWEDLSRCFEFKYGYRYYKPGWDGGGLFMQFLPGIFIDQRGTLMGRSAKEFAASQMVLMNEIGVPVWGWSASNAVLLNISGTQYIAFDYSGSGSRNTLQFKLKDKKTEFSYRLYNKTNELGKALINLSMLRDSENRSIQDLKNITAISFAIESGKRDNQYVGDGGNGNLTISNITLISNSKVDEIDFYGNWKTEKENYDSCKSCMIGFSPKSSAKALDMKYGLGTGDDWVQIVKNYGYLGQYQIENQTVTPHASALAVYYFPEKVYDNLKKLENLGARDPAYINGTRYDFGFRDSVSFRDADNKNRARINEGYLTLDQEMLLLSIANYLNGSCWKFFMADDVYSSGIKLIEDYDGRLIYFGEGENWTEQQGGNLDNKSKASNCLCLGNSWGDNNDYVEYVVNLEDGAQEVILKLRYSDKFDGNNRANKLHIYWDGSPKEIQTNDTMDWNTFRWTDELYLGNISKGQHRLKIASENELDLNCVNIDCFKLFRR